MSVLSLLASRLSSILGPARRIMPVAVARSPPPVSESTAKRARTDTLAQTASTNGAADSSANTNGTGPDSPAAPVPKKAKKKQAKGDVPAGTSFRPLPTPPTPDDLASVESEMALPFELERAYAHEVDYRGKLVLAPMVRTGTLPTRLLSLYYGAGLVWTPEIVDKAIIGAERSVDPVTGVITYHKGQGPIFTCHPIEKPFLIFQIGSSNPELAVQAARVVAQDVSGIDLNCGCPKPFSTHAGMGAALLSTPDTLLDILRGLLAAIPLPISAKIRLMPTRAETLLLAARILRTGVRNLTVHCRTRDMRPREKAIHERLAEVVALGKRRGVSVTCNGDGEGWDNWEQIKKETGADSLMIARAAECNPSCFSPVPEDATTVVVPQLLSWVQHTGHNWGNTKFLLSQFKPGGTLLSKQQKKDAMQAVARGKSVDEVAAGLRAIGGPTEGIEVSADRGVEFMAELGRRLRARSEWAEWEGAQDRRDAEVAAMAAAAAQEAAEKQSVQIATKEEAEERAASAKDNDVPAELERATA